MYVKLLIYIITLLFVTGCNNGTPNEKLNNAEILFAEHPDSAVMMLSAIDERELDSRDLAMRCSLLSLLSKDCILHSEPADSLADVVLNYYSDKNDDMYLFLALYCKGRALQHSGQAAKAMLSYTRARQMVDEIENPVYIGMLYSGVAELYFNAFDYGRALENFRTAHLHYRISGSIYREHDALVDIALVLMEQKKYTEAEQCLLDELQWGFEKQDKHICQSSVENLLLLYDRTKYLHKANWLLDSDYFRMCDSTMIVDRALAYIYAVDNDKQMSRRYMQRAWDKSESINDTLMNLMCMYDISKAEGRKEDALDILENIHYIHDTIMRSALQQPVLSAQRDYYQTQAQINGYMLSETKRLAVTVVIVILLLLCIAILVLRNRIIMKNAEVERYATLADDISAKLDNHNAQVELMNRQVGELFKKQFELLDELSEIYYETRDIKKDKDAIYRQVRDNIEALMKDKKTVAKLENIVNSYRNDIMKRLRSQVTQLGEHELRFLVFVYAGFSSKAISIFMQESVGNVYTKKSRIKSMIMHSDSPDKEFFIEAMS